MTSAEAPARTIRFRLEISAGAIEDFYRGRADTVVVRALDGRRLRFPARLLRDFVGHDGVHGLFEMRFDANFRCTDLRRLGR